MFEDKDKALYCPFQHLSVYRLVILKFFSEVMQRERQEETEHDDVMEENAGPLLINKLEVLRQI